MSIAMEETIIKINYYPNEMYRSLNKQIFPNLKQKQILTSVTAVTD